MTTQPILTPPQIPSSTGYEIVEVGSLKCKFKIDNLIINDVKSNNTLITQFTNVKFPIVNMMDAEQSDLTFIRLERLLLTRAGIKTTGKEIYSPKDGDFKNITLNNIGVLWSGTEPYRLYREYVRNKDNHANLMSDYVGVFWHMWSNKWALYNNDRDLVGLFDSKEEAECRSVKRIVQVRAARHKEKKVIEKIGVQEIPKSEGIYSNVAKGGNGNVYNVDAFFYDEFLSSTFVQVCFNKPCKFPYIRLRTWEDGGQVCWTAHCLVLKRAGVELSGREIITFIDGDFTNLTLNNLKVLWPGTAQYHQYREFVNGVKTVSNREGVFWHVWSGKWVAYDPNNQLILTDDSGKTRFFDTDSDAAIAIKNEQDWWTAPGPYH